jgi:hypothetical protein
MPPMTELPLETQFQQAAAAQGIDRAWAEQQMNDIATQQAIANKMQSDKLQVEMLKAERKELGNKSGIASVGAGIVATVAVDKAVHAAKNFRNPEALAQKTGQVLLDEVGKGGKFRRFGSFNHDKVVENIGKQLGKDSLVTGKATEMLGHIENASKQSGQSVQKLTKQSAEKIMNSSELKNAAKEQIAQKPMPLLTNAVQGTRDVIQTNWSKLPPNAQKVVGSALAIGTLYAAYKGGVAISDKLQEGKENKRGTIDEQIKMKEGEAALFAAQVSAGQNNAVPFARADGRSWRDYVKETNPAGIGAGQGLA